MNNQTTPTGTLPIRTAVRCPTCRAKLKHAIMKSTERSIKTHMQAHPKGELHIEPHEKLEFSCPGGCKEIHWVYMMEALAFLKAA